MMTEEIPSKKEIPSVKTEIRTTKTVTTDPDGKKVIVKETFFDDGTSLKSKTVEHIAAANHPDVSKAAIAEGRFVPEKNSSSGNEGGKEEAKSMFRTEDGKIKKKWWLALVLTVLVIAGAIGGITAAIVSKKSASTQSKCNYQVDLSLEYECDNLPVNYEDNFEPALIDYHEYVSIQESQSLSNVSVTLVNYRPNACIQTPDRRRDLADGNSHRELLRGLRKSTIQYNLFAFCFGPCPEQALPSIPTINRRHLKENDDVSLRQRISTGFKNLFPEKRYLGGDPFPDVLPFLTKFKEIFQEIVEVKVTEAKTNIAGTKKLDCGRNTTDCNNGACCGQNDCRCSVVSESFCRTTNCSEVGAIYADDVYGSGDIDYSGGSCCQYDFCTQTDSCYCASTGCYPSNICCVQNTFSFCKFCDTPPTNFPSTPTGMPYGSYPSYPYPSSEGYPTFPSPSYYDYPNY